MSKNAEPLKQLADELGIIADSGGPRKATLVQP
jgi:hypothetical protein